MTTAVQTKETNHANPLIEGMFKAGAHYAFSRSRRHPSVKPYIFGVKNRVEIFDLEKTKETLDRSLEFVRALAKDKKTILLVGGKNEAQKAIQDAALALEMPYVAGRWIGGTLSNFTEIRKRVDRLHDLREKKEKGELNKYTKKERLLIDRDIANLERFFSGLSLLKQQPSALFVVDARREKIAVTEARKRGIPVIALVGSDCNLKDVDYPIIGNDASLSSIAFFVNEVVRAYSQSRA